MKNKLIAFDLDGTLIDSSHRFNGDLDSWIKHSTYEFIKKDKLLPLCEIYQLLKEDGYTVIAVTARKMQVTDYYYLHENNLVFDEILHREESTEADHELKHDLMNKFLSHNKGLTPFIAFDDKEENLNIFSSFGFKTYHPDRFNFPKRI
jgi:hydroxymethylpyrimidine pyrophosphatase-like HAD family hydrolase